MIPCPTAPNDTQMVSLGLLMGAPRAAVALEWGKGPVLFPPWLGMDPCPGPAGSCCPELRSRGSRAGVGPVPLALVCMPSAFAGHRLSTYSPTNHPADRLLPEGSCHSCTDAPRASVAPALGLRESHPSSLPSLVSPMPLILTPLCPTWPLCQPHRVCYTLSVEKPPLFSSVFPLG